MRLSLMQLKKMTSLIDAFKCIVMGMLLGEICRGAYDVASILAALI